MMRHTAIPLKYSNEIPVDGIKDDGLYNQELFYRNDTLLESPDNFILYISDTESSEYGYYYLYGTIPGLGAYRSKDLQHWEDVSKVTGYHVFEPAEDDWLRSDFWAPEIVYDKETKLYYLFSSGTPQGEPIGAGTPKKLFVATATEPYGPFKVPDEAKIFWDETLANAAIPEADRGCWLGGWVCIDPSPFIGADGEKYLLFMRAGDVGDEGYDSIWGVRMKNWLTPDYQTLTRLTSNGYLTTERTERADYEWERIRNEGPHMYVRQREDETTTYYLTFSINGLNDYTVIQAVGDAPLGPFRKLTEEEGGILLANDHLIWDHIKGPGHHSFLQVGEELFIVYHQQGDRVNGDSWVRTLSMDRVMFTRNGQNKEVMVSNGPTWSLQPKPEAVATYRNIAPEAEIVATAGQHVDALNDGILSIYKGVDFVKEFESEKTVSITVSFDDYREVTGLMIYNSKDYEKTFVSVDRVEFDFKDDVSPEGGMTYIDNLEFDWKSYKNATIDDMRPGGSAVAVFEPMQVKEIRIRFDLPEQDSKKIIGVSEIVVLGK